ncbi:hypothetical protein E5K00_15125 [Hymenobacter aquaticus]|uniref:Uncharacterized protein n=1 Tax=Hymenobacter aquaticus TaxID=1867101 RepID=A0A4Z0PWA7_9BACT|nr:hypothetical protein [Hymenobacter aquaticus]TGE21609.1 hypothetical protein E5K00_15125 [Hymenobacter aquaticus]
MYIKQKTMKLDEGLAAVVAAIIGIAAGVISGVLSARYQSRIEHEKWQRALSDGFRSELRATVQQLTHKLSEAIHSMCWLTWQAEYGPEKLTQERIDQYDEEMHRLLPQIIGLHAVLAGMDYEVFSQLRGIVDDALKQDAGIGYAHLAFTEQDKSSARGLASQHEQAVALESQLSQAVAEAIRGYSIQARHAG